MLTRCAQLAGSVLSMHSTAGLADEAGPGCTAAKLETELVHLSRLQAFGAVTEKACSTHLDPTTRSMHSRHSPTVDALTFMHMAAVWRVGGRQTPILCCGGTERMYKPCSFTLRTTSFVLGRQHA